MSIETLYNSFSLTLFNGFYELWLWMKITTNINKRVCGVEMILLIDKFVELVIDIDAFRCFLHLFEFLLIFLQLFKLLLVV